MAPRTFRLLATDWQFAKLDDEQTEWLPVSQIPTSVHQELKLLKKIPDPFLGLHEWDVQWIGECRWAFKTTFNITDNDLESQFIDLVLDGLDCYATVLLSGQEILRTQNQFLSYRSGIRERLKSGPNELQIHFDNTFAKGRKLEKEHGKFNLWNGDSSRLHIRKAQYNYGWDWGPVLMTVGPWKPIGLEIYNNRITDLDIRCRVSETLDSTVIAEFNYSPGRGFVVFTLNDPDGKALASSAEMPTETGTSHVSFELKAGTLDLWYPVGYGKQPLYTAVVQLFDQDGKLLDTRSQKVAFRRARVVEDKLQDEEGLTFLFEINNIRIFCGGSNWIPADSFLTTVTPERYRAWLQLLVEGNQNMVRVWGGGIYEADIFYDICDELGIMVWQDFMFGCGQYPAYDSFLESVSAEAEQNVKRLRHHPSVVIFAGNNEDYQIAESLKLELDYSDETSDFRKTNFPARHIYERVLPEIVHKYSDIYYHRASPYSGHGRPTTDRTFGDIHQWNVWHGSQEPWHNWDKLSGRFVSEFGMQGFPNIRTVDYWLAGDESERYPQSRFNNNHNKADGFERRLELYLMENFKHSFEMESYVYYTQVMQAETLASAYRLWRRNWKGRGREYTAGALVWQLNDCWPVTSWAIVDYFLRPKPSYFTIARELRPYTVGMTRKEQKTFPNELSAENFIIETVLEIWGTNSTLEEKHATLEVTSFDLHSDWKESWTKQVTLSRNASTELFKGSLPGQPSRTRLSEVAKDIIVAARLLDQNRQVLGRYANWPEPFKFIKFPSREEVALTIEADKATESLVLSVKKPVKGVVLDVEGPDVIWSDQALDLVPGDPQTVVAKGLNGREVLADRKSVV